MTDINPLGDTEAYNRGYHAGVSHTIEQDYKANLRDAMAMAALTGLLAQAKGHQYTGINNQASSIARDSYELADAMLVQRESK